MNKLIAAVSAAVLALGFGTASADSFGGVHVPDGEAIVMAGYECADAHGGVGPSLTPTGDKGFHLVDYTPQIMAAAAKADCFITMFEAMNAASGTDAFDPGVAIYEAEKVRLASVLDERQSIYILRIGGADIVVTRGSVQDGAYRSFGWVN
ncbi:MAG: hypothetical protein GEU71_16815 [Actinobacteria bacterium]|nr:hypothetical protein [Actinomycetota bacterium]